ncbi:MAG: BatA domain-containing protein, partial [Verrucomicrobiota bacterium]
MSFLGPAFLLGLLGLSLPVLIHLLKRRRLQIVAWAAHRFLQATLKKQKRRVQFEDLILLLLRCLVLALLAFAFARPVFQDNAGPGDGNAGQLVLLVDLSASMGWTDGVRTSLDRAADEAARELAAAPAGTAAALLGFSDRVHPVVARPTTDLAVVRRELSRLRTMGRGTDLAPALRATIDLFDTLPTASRRIVVIGDKQRLGFRDQDNLTALVARAREAGVALAFRDIAPERPANLAVTRLVADSDQVLAGQPVRLQAEIFNGGSTPAANLRVTLHAGDELPVAERLLPGLAAGERATVEFTYLPPAAGFQPLTVRVPADPLAADDFRSLVIRVSDGTRVL